MSIFWGSGAYSKMGLGRKFAKSSTQQCRNGRGYINFHEGMSYFKIFQLILCLNPHALIDRPASSAMQAIQLFHSSITKALNQSTRRHPFIHQSLRYCFKRVYITTLKDIEGSATLSTLPIPIPMSPHCRCIYIIRREIKS